MAVFKRGGVWWYKFYFAGQFIRESSKSTSKTVARDAENQRRRELEQGYHNLRQKREIRIRLLRDIADEYLADYELRFRGSSRSTEPMIKVFRKRRRKAAYQAFVEKRAGQLGKLPLLSTRFPGHRSSASS